jgi:hypothetical protein
MDVQFVAADQLIRDAEAIATAEALAALAKRRAG